MNAEMLKLQFPLFSLLMFLSPLLCSAYEIGFNSGSKTSYITPNGRVYRADEAYTAANGAGYIGGYIGKSPDGVKSGGTRDYDLYIQDRRGLKSYQFNLPQGPYVVKLHFSETEHSWRNLRVFDIWIEDEKVLEALDIFEKVRRNYVVDYQFAVHVTDGQLNVKFVANQGASLLSGIYVFSRESDQEKPRVPRHFSVIGGYDQAILHWTANPEDDLHGYNVYRAENGQFHLLDFSSSSAYIDRAVKPHHIYQYEVSAVDLYGNTSNRATFRSVIILEPSDSELPVYDLYTDESHLAYLSQHIWDDVTVPTLLRHDGVEYRGVRMRHRGGAARRAALKPSIKLIFPDNQLFQGKKRLNLQSDTWDSSLMRSKLAFDDYQRADALAPKSEWVHLRLNDEFMGVYTAVDQVDEHFLSTNGLNPTGNIYKPFDFLVVLPDAGDYTQLAEKETNRGRIDNDLKEFVELINLTPEHLIREKLWEVLDVESYLNWYCANQLISNWDIAGHNFFLYHDLTLKKWDVIAWDPDVSYVQEDMPLDEGSRNSPMYGIPNWWDRLIDRVLNVPVFRRMYCLRLSELLNTTFADANRLSRVEIGHQRIRFDGERDTKKPGWLENHIWFYPSRRWIRDFSTLRNQFLHASIPDFIPPPSVNLFINEIAAEGWIEIYNWSPKESVNLGGMFLSDDEDHPTKIPLPDRNIDPLGHLLVNSHLVKMDGGLIALFEKRDRGGISLVNQKTYPAFSDDSTDRATFGRRTDGSGKWDILSEPTPEAPNLWRSPVVFAPDTKHDISPQRIIKGDRRKLTVTLKNQTDKSRTVQLWTELFLTGGSLYSSSPPVRPKNIRLNPQERLEYQLEIATPKNLPFGIAYRYAIRIGSINSFDVQIWDTLSVHLSFFSGTVTGHLYINELMGANRQTIVDEYGEYSDWMELYNSSDQTVSLDGMYLSDDMRAPTKWKIRSAKIAPRDYCIFWLDGDESQGPRHTSFNLSASGEGIGIFDADEHGNSAVDWIAFGSQTPDVSVGRYPDGADRIESCALATPGESNIYREPNVSLNELMVTNRITLSDETGEYDPWIELYNPSCHTINLEGLYMSDSASDRKRWKFPFVEVRAGEFAIVWADNEIDEGKLHTPFRLTPDGGSVLLFDTDENGNKLLDALHFEEQTEEVSLGRHPNGIGTWNIFRTPTPGSLNVRAQLLINEVMSRNNSTTTDEAGDYEDWIELYNPTNGPVNLDGLFLSDDLDNLEKWPLPSAIVPGRQFILLWADSNDAAGEFHTTFSLNSNSEVLSLYESKQNGVVIDSLEFPSMMPDVSYGRVPDGNITLEMFNTPTPGMSNIRNYEDFSGPIRLMQNYPNPHSAETVIPYRLSNASHVVLTIFNVQGQEVRHVDLGFREIGSYVNSVRAIHWDGRNELGELVAAGAYFYRLASENHHVTRKLTIVR